MHIDIDIAIALAGLVVGIVVGLTGMGGGALMTPVLVIGFGIAPLAAVSSDLVASVVMKPIGGGIHFRRGTVHTGLVRWLAVGSVPGAITGAYVVSHLPGDVGPTIKVVLGVVLLVAAGAMLARGYLSAHRGAGIEGPLAARIPVRRGATFLVGLLGGAVVGLTSVGSGSLMIVVLMLLYPTMSSKELVGTDLVQAVPLVLAAAVGHLLWGDFELALTGSLLLGSVPGVVIGAHVSSRAKDSLIRPVLVLVLTLSALKLLGASDVLLVGAMVGAVLGAGCVLLVMRRRRGRPPRPNLEPVSSASATRDRTLEADGSGARRG